MSSFKSLWKVRRRFMTPCRDTSKSKGSKHIPLKDIQEISQNPQNTVWFISSASVPASITQNHQRTVITVNVGVTEARAGKARGRIKGDERDSGHHSWSQKLFIKATPPPAHTHPTLQHYSVYLSYYSKIKHHHPDLYSHFLFFLSLPTFTAFFLATVPFYTPSHLSPLILKCPHLLNPHLFCPWLFPSRSCLLPSCLLFTSSPPSLLISQLASPLPFLTPPSEPTHAANLSQLNKWFLFSLPITVSVTAFTTDLKSLH